jgi:FAD/FMN-containing dehydrogenase/NAD-dependent dihydropyrimidine dehydrogenase PreA subunit
MEGRAAGATAGGSVPFAAKVEQYTGLAEEIARLGIPDLRIIGSPGELAIYSRDQSDVPRLVRNALVDPIPDAVVQPRTTEAVERIVSFARWKGLPIIPRGSASSPFGGAVPVNRGIVVDMCRMDAILSIDEESKTATVQAGARWADIDHELGKKGLRLVSSPSSKFSTVGGWVAGGGIGVGSLGGNRLGDNVRSLVIVPTSGSRRKICRLDRHFHEVFDSEGQLGVITEVTLDVRKKDPAGRPHLLIVDDLMNAVSIADSLRSLAPRPDDLIYFSPGKLSYSNKLLHSEHFRAGHALLVTSGDSASEQAIVRLLNDKGLKEEPEYLARLISHDRFFPMKLRRLGPGMLGAEVLAPFIKLRGILAKAEGMCKDLRLDPLLEVHFLAGQDALVLCYYLTDQNNELLYTLDAAKSMIVTAALIDLGARPYSLGIWNNSFADRIPEKQFESLRSAKADFDPDDLMNRGKYFRVEGKYFGVPGRLFSPQFSGPGLRLLAILQRPLAPFLNAASSYARGLSPKQSDEIILATEQCANCGACVGVCPAYKVLGDERVTARGKLLTARALMSGDTITPEHAHRTFLCMRCKACEQVCQSKLELIPIYDKLEAMLEKQYGKDAAEIEAFVRFAEASPEYDALLQRGLVLGAPKNGMGGDVRV